VGIQDELEPILTQIRSEAQVAWDKSFSRIPAEDKERDAATYQKAANEFYGTVDDLLTRFRRYYAFDAHDFQVNVDQLASPEGGPQLYNRPTGGTADGCIFSAQDNFMKPVANMIDEDEWTGSAARSFEENFLKKLETASLWQRQYARELAIAAAALQVASGRSKRAIKFVAESCLSALSGGRPMYQGELGFADTTKDLPGKDVADSVGIITGVIGLFASGPIGLAVGVVGLASGLYGVAKTGSTEPYLQVDHGGSPQTTVRWTGDAIKNLEEWIADQDEALAKGLNEDLKSEVAFGSRNLRVPAPGIDAGTYKQLDFYERPGGLNQTVVSVVKLGRAGAYNLPDAADQYDQAASNVENCQIPGSLSQFFPRSISPFNTAVDQLGDILRDTSKSLRRAGDVMLTAARNYEATDEDEAEMIRQIEQVPEYRTIAPTK
jgi:hypothetical protein